jgi:hypothetical protein
MAIRTLFLHGFSGQPNGSKYEALRAAQPALELHPPLALPFPDRIPEGLLEKAKALLGLRSMLKECQRIAQEAVDAFRPDVIVGSSMGGALAIQLSTSASLVLIAPATRIRWLPPGIGPFPDRPVPPETIILHSSGDDLVPLEASERLLGLGGPPGAREALVEEKLRKGGYKPVGGRLLVLGADHRCNHPHPDDAGDPLMHPHVAMVNAVQYLGKLRQN